jgi:hypothetical protein
VQNPGASRREIADVCPDQGAYMINVIACDKREALAQESATDEAIHSFCCSMDCLAGAHDDD